MIVTVSILFSTIFCTSMGKPTDNKTTSSPIVLHSRADWEARTPVELTPLETPVPFVVIHHSYKPSACYNFKDCRKAMKSMQNYHMDDHGWWDIGYNFGVGSDGAAYEGRGWQHLGAHALHFNTVSIGICLIGDWQTKLPPKEQLETVKSLIAIGVKEGYISKDYKLVGHRQVRETACPGQMLQEEIQTWPHYSAYPSSHKDIENFVEVPKKKKNS